MKKNLLLLLFVLGCSVVSAQEVKYLTTEEFKTKVFDYSKDSVWHYCGELPCIVDFYTTWCGPCKRLAPVMEELAKEYEGKVLFYKADTEKERELAGLFRITSIPTLLFVPAEGQPALSKGAAPKEDMKRAIETFLLKKQ
ncbi:MAG: thioredoxin fold domain-containing protein [Paludibacteraceae bacterium]|nr:thioredoxin fold domain-containing protein [Paludibacteraceae bacterium]